MGVRRGRDEAYRAALGGGAIQRALRTAQYFHPVDIHQPRLRNTFVARDGDEGHFIDVDAHGRIAHRGTDAANGDVVLARTVRPVVVGGEGDAGHQARNVLDAFDIQVRQVRPADDPDAHRYVFGVLAALGRRHNHFLQLSVRCCDIAAARQLRGADGSG